MTLRVNRMNAGEPHSSGRGEREPRTSPKITDAATTGSGRTVADAIPGARLNISSGDPTAVVPHNPGNGGTVGDHTHGVLSSTSSRAGVDLGPTGSQPGNGRVDEPAATAAGTSTEGPNVPLTGDGLTSVPTTSGDPVVVSFVTPGAQEGGASVDNLEAVETATLAGGESGAVEQGAADDAADLAQALELLVQEKADPSFVRPSHIRVGAGEREVIGSATSAEAVLGGVIIVGETMYAKAQKGGRVVVATSAEQAEALGSDAEVKGERVDLVKAIGVLNIPAIVDFGIITGGVEVYGSTIVKGMLAEGALVDVYGNNNVIEGELRETGMYRKVNGVLRKLEGDEAEMARAELEAINTAATHRLAIALGEVPGQDPEGKTPAPEPAPFVPPAVDLGEDGVGVAPAPTPGAVPYVPAIERFRDPNGDRVPGVGTDAVGNPIIEPATQAPVYTSEQLLNKQLYAGTGLTLAGGEQYPGSGRTRLKFSSTEKSVAGLPFAVDSNTIVDAHQVPHFKQLDIDGGQVTAQAVGVAQVTGGEKDRTNLRAKSIVNAQLRERARVEAKRLFSGVITAGTFLKATNIQDHGIVRVKGEAPTSDTAADESKKAVIHVDFVGKRATLDLVEDVIAVVQNGPVKVSGERVELNGELVRRPGEYWLRKGKVRKFVPLSSEVAVAEAATEHEGPLPARKHNLRDAAYATSVAGLTAVLGFLVGPHVADAVKEKFQPNESGNYTVGGGPANTVSLRKGHPLEGGKEKTQPEQPVVPQTFEADGVPEGQYSELALQQLLDLGVKHPTDAEMNPLSRLQAYYGKKLSPKALKLLHDNWQTDPTLIAQYKIIDSNPDEEAASNNNPKAFEEINKWLTEHMTSTQTEVGEQVVNPGVKISLPTYRPNRDLDPIDPRVTPRSKLDPDSQAKVRRVVAAAKNNPFVRKVTSA